MTPAALLLSRMQFGFPVSFHIIFPTVTVGLAAWPSTRSAGLMNFCHGTRARRMF